MFGCLIACTFAEQSVKYFLIILALSSAPVAIGGFLEDFGMQASPLERLALAILSSIVAGFMLEMWIPRLDVQKLDSMLTISFFTVTLTVLVTAGVSQAFNIIDGLHGLSIGTSVMVALCLALISATLGDSAMFQTLIIFIGAMLGLLFFNYPFGKIFLGDGGSYILGHSLGWIGIILLNRHPDIAPFSILLVFFWPIADLCFAILRRIYSRKSLIKPDRLHLHQLVRRGLELMFYAQKKRHITNPVATLIILPLAGLPMIAGLITLHNNLAAIAYLMVAIIGYTSCYYGVLKVAKSIRVTHEANPCKLTK